MCAWCVHTDHENGVICRIKGNPTSLDSSFKYVFVYLLSLCWQQKSEPFPILCTGFLRPSSQAQGVHPVDMWEVEYVLCVMCLGRSDLFCSGLLSQLVARDGQDYVPGHFLTLRPIRSYFSQCAVHLLRLILLSRIS